MRLHDTHCHVDLYEDRAALLEEIERAGIHTVAVTNAPSVYRVTERLTAGKRFVRPALGLHPELVPSHGHELDLFEQLLPNVRYVGEVGLDYASATAEERMAQRRIFERILTLLQQSGGRILTVHSRRSADDVVDMVLTHAPGPAILHWFNGGAKVLARAREAGLWFSVNHAMLRAAQGRERVAAFRRDRVLLESDGPFVDVRGVPARPSHGAEVLLQLAEVWECSLEEADIQLQFNLRACLTSLPHK